MSKPKTVGVLIEKITGDPPTFGAGAVWGAMPFLTGLEEGPTPEAAVAAVEGSLRRLGYEPTVVVFDTLEDAQAEGRRRLAAEDILGTLDHARVKLPELLAGEDSEPDARDLEATGELDRAIRAVRAVASGAYDVGKREGKPPIRDGLIICPDCGPDYPEAYFTVTADASATVHLSPTGALKTWKDVSVSDEGYREVRCGSCGALLGDLTFEDLQDLDPETKEE